MISRGPTHYIRFAVMHSLEISITFLLDKCPVSKLKGTCAILKDNHFIVKIQMEEICSHPLLWGGEARCKLVASMPDPVQCYFGTRLSRIVNGSDNAIFLVFELPGQAQYHAHGAMLNDYEFTTWSGTFTGGESVALPAMRWQELNSDWCHLAELSASGVRLDIKNTSPSAIRLSSKDNILMRVAPKWPEGSAPFFLLGQIVRIVPDAEADIISYGCVFLSWSNDKSFEKDWVDIDAQKGVPFLPETPEDSQFKVVRI